MAFGKLHLHVQKQDADPAFGGQIGYGQIGTLVHCWWACKLVQPLWTTVWRFLKKLEIELHYDSPIPLLGIHTKVAAGTQTDICTPTFLAALLTIAKR